MSRLGAVVVVVRILVVRIVPRLLSAAENRETVKLDCLSRWTSGGLLGLRFLEREDLSLTLVVNTFD